MSSLRKFAGQTLIYGLSTIISRLLNFVLTPLLVRKFPAAVYGVFTNLYAWAAIINAILAFGMETTFFRYLQKHEDNKEKVYSNTFFVILSLVVVFVAGTVLFTKDIATWILAGEDPVNTIKYIRYFVFILAADALAVIPFAQIRANGRPIRYGLIKLANVLIFVGFTTLFIFFIPIIIQKNSTVTTWIQGWYQTDWVGYVFLANLIASTVTLLLLLPELLKIRFQVDSGLIKEMFWYSFPILIANISFIINEILDKILLDKLLPVDIAKTEVGAYGAAAKVAVFLSIFVQAFRLGAEPFFFSQAKKMNAGKTYAIIMDYFVICMSIIMVGLVANIEILKYFIEGGSPIEQANYWSALPVVPVLLLGYVFLGIYMSLSIWYKLSDQTKFGLYISSIGAVFTIVMNIVFIPYYSYVASAWITMGAYGIMMVLSFVLGQKNYPIPYHVFKNVSYIFAAICISWLCFSIFNRSLVIGNLLFILFLVSSFWIERKQLKEIIVRKE